MTEVTIFKNCNSQIIGFQVLGHAEYAEAGEDIVCSAISALTISVINTVMEVCPDDFHVDSDDETGYIELRFDGEPGHDALVIMKVFEIGVTEISESYNDYICLTFKEV